MNSVNHLTAWIEGIGIIGPGIDGWETARALLRGERDYVAAPTALPAPEVLPPAERRRASRIVKAALTVGLQACRMAGREPASLANVFASSGGDGYTCHPICEQLAAGDTQISPTRFHNSVHNAASGYWSIATGATPAAQVLAAYDASFAAGLLEAMTQIASTGQPVLLVAVDSEYPAPLHAKRPIADTAGLALVLAPTRGPAALAQVRLPLRGALRDGPASALAAVAPHAAAGLEAAIATLPSMRGMPLVGALCGDVATKNILIESMPPQCLGVEMAPA